MKKGIMKDARLKKNGFDLKSIKAYAQKAPKIINI